MIAGLLLAARLHDSLAVRNVRVAPDEVLRVTAVGTGLLLSALARRMVESDDPAEVEKLKSALTHGFYGN